MDSTAANSRTDLQGIANAFQRGEPVKVFKHAGGWSVQCDAGLLENSGIYAFETLEPLLAVLKANGIDCLIVEL
jgi:hypothetical protein